MHSYLRKHSIEMPIQTATSLLRESPKSNVANTHRLYQKPTPDRHARLYSEQSEDLLHVHHLKAMSVPQFCCQAVAPPWNRYLGMFNRPLNVLRRYCLLLSKLLPQSEQDTFRQAIPGLLPECPGATDRSLKMCTFPIYIRHAFGTLTFFSPRHYHPLG